MPIVGSFAGASSRAYGLQASLIGDFESIATTTVGAGGVSSVTFSDIPQTYTHLQIRGIARGASTTGQLDLQFNSDTAANYSRHYVYGDGSTAASFGASGTSIIRLATISSSSSLSNTFGFFVADILDYANTNKYKTVRCLGGLDVNGVGGELGLRSGNWRSNSAITSIKLWTGDATNLAQYSSIALYGIKG